MTDRHRAETDLGQLVRLEVSAACFVRNYVELHFDGSALRVLSDPFGRYGCQGWRFPEGNSPTVMRCYIGKTIDGFGLIPDRLLALDFGERRFAIPLDDQSRVGPEAAHLLIPRAGDAVPGREMWTRSPGMLKRWRTSSGRSVKGPAAQLYDALVAGRRRFGKAVEDQAIGTRLTRLARAGWRRCLAVGRPDYRLGLAHQHRFGGRWMRSIADQR